MTKRKNNKRALVLSAMALMLCLTMLVGSTFAWFTDNASTAVNSIQSGTLEIGLYTDAACTQTAEGKTLSFTKGGANVLWEPGATWSLPTVYIKNEGNLAVKYKVEIAGINGDAKLNEVIDWTITDGTTDGAGHLAANGATQAITISGHMKEAAGNDYQGLTIDGIGITVLAAQDTVEYDSTTNQYDANATYDKVEFAASTDELKDVIADAEGPVDVVLSSGTYMDILDIPMKNKDVTISGGAGTVIDLTNIQTAMLQDMTGTNITFDGVEVDFSDYNEGYQGVKNPEKVVYKDCTIKGTQFLYGDADFINCTFETENGYSVWTYGANNVTFSGCTFNTQGRAILVYNEETASNFVANVTVTNCTFNDNGTYSSAKAAVETGSNANTEASNKYNLTFSGCTLNGFEQNNSTSALWGNKNSMDNTHLNVIINGTDVY